MSYFADNYYKKGELKMENKAKLYVSVEEKDKYINALTEELPMLRAKANKSQDELAKFIGISRQKCLGIHISRWFFILIIIRQPTQC